MHRGDEFVPDPIAATRAENEEALVEATRRMALVLRAGLAATTLTLPQVGMEFTSRMKQKLSTPGRGRMYRGRRGRGDHRASAPGDPPAVDTGQYRASWTYRTGSQGPLRYVEVGTADKRAPHLEFSTRHMKARPHARPTAMEYARDLGKRVAAAQVAGERGAIAKLPRQKL